MQSRIINISKLDHYSKKRLKRKHILHGRFISVTDGKQHPPHGTTAATGAANALTEAHTPRSFSAKLSRSPNCRFAQVTKGLLPRSARTQDPGGETQTVIQKGNRNINFIGAYSRFTPAAPTGCAAPVPHPAAAQRSHGVPGARPDTCC